VGPQANRQQGPEQDSILTDGRRGVRNWLRRRAGDREIRNRQYAQPAFRADTLCRDLSKWAGRNYDETEANVEERLVPH
jgi:hypothetical protein